MLFDKNKAFTPLTKQEQKQKEERKKAADKQIQKLKDSARECYDSPQFKIYRNLHEESKEAFFTRLMNINLPTVEAEWKLFNEIRSDYQAITSLLFQVETHLD